jgi:type 1 glutamine amidotransferase
LKWILEDCGRFGVEVSSSPPAGPRAPQAPKGNATPQQKATHEAALAKWKGEKSAFDQTRTALWQQWRPKFKDYAVVVCNYNGEAWPEEVKRSFVEYVKSGGGVVIVHAADNAFGDWPEYNEIIALGGWGGRNEKSGPMIRWRDGKIVEDNSPGAGGTHGAQYEFVVETRVPDHPIMRGLPAKWKQAQDELYSKLRGPAKNLTVLATAYADPATRGTGENEPILMTINYGQGRCFHTVMGHGPQAMSGLGFQVTLQRGAEWAATGQVTLLPPKEGGLSADKAALRPVAVK